MSLSLPRRLSHSSFGFLSSFVIRLSSFLLILLTLTPSARAWSSAGHMIIAAEAYRDLSPKLQAKVTALLQSHPDYDKWAKAYAAGPTNMDLATYVFLRSS